MSDTDKHTGRRMLWTADDVAVSHCADCAHKNEAGPFCPAFPESIPDHFLLNQRHHNQLDPEQTGSLTWIPGPDIKTRLSSRRYAAMD